MKCIVLYFLLPLWGIQTSLTAKAQELIANKYAGLWEAHLKELMAKVLLSSFQKPVIPFKSLWKISLSNHHTGVNSSHSNPKAFLRLMEGLPARWKKSIGIAKLSAQGTI